MLRFSALLLGALLFLAAPAHAEEVNRVGEYGFKLTLSDRWENVYEQFEDRQFGGSLQMMLEDDTGVAQVMLTVAKAHAMGLNGVAVWKDRVLNDPTSGVLQAYSENRGFKKKPVWQESTATIGSGQAVMILSTPPVNINGNERQIRVAYLATETHWYLLFVGNRDKSESLDEDWSTILGGLTVVGPTGIASVE